jgi:hypothetical protein
LGNPQRLVVVKERFVVKNYQTIPSEPVVWAQFGQRPAGGHDCEQGRQLVYYLLADIFLQLPRTPFWLMLDLEVDV